MLFWGFLIIVLVYYTPNPVLSIKALYCFRHCRHLAKLNRHPSKTNTERERERLLEKLLYAFVPHVCLLSEDLHSPRRRGRGAWSVQGRASGA